MKKSITVAVATGAPPLCSSVPKKRPRQSGSPAQPLNNFHEENTVAIARAETRTIKSVCAFALLVLLSSAAVLSTAVYRAMRQEEQESFALNFQQNALQVIQAFHRGLEQNLGAVGSMSSAITSYANQANLSFPFVTVPDFDILGSHCRVQSGSHVLVYAPFVADDDRIQWEEYAMKRRGHFELASETDSAKRVEYDSQVAVERNSSHRQQEDYESPSVLQEDGTGLYPGIFGSYHDEPVDSGPYMPLWQRSPVEDLPYSRFNYEVAQLRLKIANLYHFLHEEKKAVLNPVAFPTPENQEWLEETLVTSELRYHVGKDANDLPHSYLVYPVFDSFDDDGREVAGILIMDISWNSFFRHLLQPTSVGIIVEIENSLGNVFSFRIDGPQVSLLEPGDTHDTKYDDQEVSEDIASFIQDNLGAHNRAYVTVGLSDLTNYRLRVFPSPDMEGRYMSDRPLKYALALAVVFTFACALLIIYSFLVEKRQMLMMENVIENAGRAAEVERNLNEFLAHEVRNPLSAAISASTFVASALNEAQPLIDEETRQNVRDDISVVNESLHFINDFLISMLDIYKARGNRITLEMRPAYVKRDIFEPIAGTVRKRASSFQVLVDCPDNLVVMTDRNRLKQVVLNLTQNASKFVANGFIRMRAEVVDHQVFLYVEDSGPGVSPDKKGELFSKYQKSLDLVSQGTGVDVNLSKNLMEILNGDLYLDESYKSGLARAPGARFVIQLNAKPLDVGPSGSFQDITQSTVACSSSSHDPSNLPVNDILLPQPSQVIPLREQLAPSTQLPEGLSCLFVDDDPMLRKLFTRAIKKVAPSWNVQDAPNGETALEICEKSSTRFHLIFMDQYMSSFEKQLLGTETVEAMRKKGIDSKICGLSANDVSMRFLDSGADYFILKPLPCKPADLRAALSKILYLANRD